MRPTLYSRHLNSFCITARCGSFAKAAQLLHISPTALLKQLNLFEDNLQVKLFKRSTQGLQLTPAGELLLSEAPALMAQCDALTARLRSLTDQDCLKVGTSPLIDATYITALFLQHADKLKGLKLSLVPFNNEQQEAQQILFNLGQRIDVVSGLYDRDFLDTFGAAALFIEKVPLQLALPCTHPLHDKESLAFSDLKDTCIYIPPPLPHCFDEAADYLEHLGLNIKVKRFNFFSVEGFNQALAQQALVLNIRPWQQVHPLFALKSLPWNLTADFGLIHSKTPTPACRRFLDVISQSLIRPE